MNGLITSQPKKLIIFKATFPEVIRMGLVFVFVNRRKHEPNLNTVVVISRPT